MRFNAFCVQALLSSHFRACGLWRLLSPNTASLEGHTEQVIVGQFSPDGKWLATALEIPRRDCGIFRRARASSWAKMRLPACSISATTVRPCSYAAARSRSSRFAKSPPVNPDAEKTGKRRHAGVQPGRQDAIGGRGRRGQTAGAGHAVRSCQRRQKDHAHRGRSDGSWQKRRLSVQSRRQDGRSRTRIAISCSGTSRAAPARRCRKAPACGSSLIRKASCWWRNAAPNRTRRPARSWSTIPTSKSSQWPRARVRRRW